MKFTGRVEYYQGKWGGVYERDDKLFHRIGVGKFVPYGCYSQIKWMKVPYETKPLWNYFPGDPPECTCLTRDVKKDEKCRYHFNQIEFIQWKAACRINIIHQPWELIHDRTL